MGTIVRQWPRLDPRTGIVVFGLWCFWIGMSWALPGDAFRASAIYSALVALGVPERPLGFVAVLLACAMLYCVKPVASQGLRLGICFLAGTFWMLIGVALLIGGYENGFLSGAGAFAVCGGLGSIVSVMQWMANP